MSGENQNIRIAADLGDANSVLRSFSSAIDSNTVALEKMVVTALKVNKEGEVTRAVFKGMTDDMRKVTIEATNIEGRLRPLNTRISESRDLLLEQAKAAREAATANKLLQTNLTAGGAFQSIGIDTGSLDDRLKSVADRLQRRLSLALAQPGGDKIELSRLLNDAAAGSANAEVGANGRVQEIISKIYDLKRRINTESDKEAATAARTASIEAARFAKAQEKASIKDDKRQEQEFRELTARLNQGVANNVTGQLRDLFPAPSSASLVQLAQYENRLRSINALIAAGKVSAADVNRIAQAVSQGQVLGNLNVDQGKVQNALVSVRSEFARLGSQGTTAVDTLSRTWERFEGIIGRVIIRNTLFALIRGIQDGARQFIELEQKLGQVQIAAAGTGLSFQQISQSIRSLSDNSGLKQLDLANASLQLFQQRATSGAEGMELLNRAVTLSIATNSSAAQGVEALTSTLNAFRLSNQEAERVSGILFRTAQLGHTTLDQVASGMARSAQAAIALGLPIQEVAGFIATLGQNGLTAGQATSLLESLMQKLLSPGRDLQQIFERWGTHTGEATVATFGFVGTLQRLFQETKGNFSELDKLVGGFRELSGVLGVSGEGFSQFQRNTNEVGSSVNRMNAAFATASQNTGRQLQEELTRISNFFTNEIGGKFIQTLSTVTSSFGGLGKVTNVVTVTVLGLGAAWGVLRLGMIAANAVHQIKIATSIASTSALAAETNGTIALTAATIRLRAALLATLSATGVGLLLAGLSIVATNAISSVNETSAAASAAIDRIRQEQAAAAGEASQQADRQRQQISENLRLATQGVNQYVAAANRVLTELARQAGEALKRVQENLKIVSESVLGDIKNKLSDIRRQASEARSDIERSQRLSQTFQANASERLFNRQVGFEGDPFRSLELIRNRIATLRQEASELFRRGDRASVEEGRRKFEQAEQLIEQAFRKEVEIQQERVRQGIIQPIFRTDPLGVTRQLTPVDAAAPQREINDLIRQRQQLEEQYRQQLARTQEEARRAAIAEEIRMLSVRRAIDALANFNAFDTHGEIRQEFRRGTPQESVAAFQAEFERRRQVVERLIGPEATRQLDQLNGLSDQRSIIARQIELTITRDQSQQLQIRIENLRRHYDEQVQLQRRAADQAIGGARIQNTQVGEDLSLLGQVLGRNPSTQTSGVPGLLGLTGNAIPTQVQAAIDAARARLTAVQEINREITAAQQGGEAASQAQIDRLQQAKDRLKAAFDELIAVSRRFAATRSSTELTIAQQAQGSNPAITTNAVFENLQARITTLRQNAQAFEDAQRASRLAVEESERAATRLNRLQQSLRDVPALATESARAMQQVMQQTSTNIGNVAQSIERLAQAIERLRNQPLPNPVRPGGAAVPAAQPGPLGFAEGGFVPGIGRGDTVPAMLEPGEYIWTREATQRFFPLIHALNTTGTAPRGYQSGGSVTNVGDITVQVQGGKHNDITARELAYAVRREIRRGTITLDQLTG